MSMHPKIQGIYALCDNSQNPKRSHAQIAEELLKGGVSILQLRMKGEKEAAKIMASAQSVLSLKEKYDFIFILNDFVEIAKALPVDGIHLGQDDVPLSEARKILGKDRWIGYSSHSLEEARAAERMGADYVAFGAIFPTVNKGPGHPIQGLEKLREVVQALKVPVVAIGGIGRQNFDQVAATGVSAIAMIGALTTAPNLSVEARWFLERWKSQAGSEAG